MSIFTELSIMCLQWLLIDFHVSYLETYVFAKNIKNFKNTVIAC
jgi:hypothetical protein